MMRALVAVACLASAGVVAVYTHYSSGNTGEQVYTVPARAPGRSPASAAPAPPAPAPPAPAAAARPIDPTDHAALARALQRELKRVGCYQGEITGMWATSSRMAMKTFNERVNATLPVDNPDPVLLSLVQGHRDRACGTACPAGQTQAEGGACLPNAMAAKAAKTVHETKSGAEGAGDVTPAAAAAGTAAAVALAAPGKTDPKLPAPQSKTPVQGAARPATSGAGGPAPPEGLVRENRPRRSAEGPAARPPKVVRDVLKALGF
jgi:hypothetical protein